MGENSLELGNLDNDKFREWNLRLPGVTIQREKLALPDGVGVWVTSILPNESTHYDLVYDRDFVDKGILTIPGGGLVSFPKTEVLWGRVPGIKPEDFIKDLPENSIGVCPTNAGWQRGAYWIKDGEVKMLKNDGDELSGLFSVFVQEQGDGESWCLKKVRLEKGRLTGSSENELGRTKCGFNLPVILDNGNPVPIEDLLEDPRISEDIRNFVDFSAGKSLPREFWGYLGQVLPRGRMVRSIIGGYPSHIVRSDALTESEVERFQTIIKDAQIEEYIGVEQSGKWSIFRVKGKLPENHVPMVGLGINSAGKLLAVAVDGRQMESPGATLEGLAKILKEKGAVYGGLGSAGGDVAVVRKGSMGSVSILNSPSIREKGTGRGITRPVPSLLVFS